MSRKIKTNTDYTPRPPGIIWTTCSACGKRMNTPDGGRTDCAPCHLEGLRTK